MNKKTLEEHAIKRAELSYYNGDERDAFVRGSAFGYQEAEKILYSEEDLREAYMIGKHGGKTQTYYEFQEWFEQFKKK